MGVEYMVLYAETPDALVAKVSAVLGQNWQPCGGVAVATVVTSVDANGRYTNAISFYQAMVREGGPPIVIHTSVLYT
jgi:hypothetical protein